MIHTLLSRLATHSFQCECTFCCRLSPWTMMRRNVTIWCFIPQMSFPAASHLLCRRHASASTSNQSINSSRARLLYKLLRLTFDLVLLYSFRNTVLRTHLPLNSSPLSSAQMLCPPRREARARPLGKPTTTELAFRERLKKATPTEFFIRERGISVTTLLLACFYLFRQCCNSSPRWQETVAGGSTLGMINLFF